MRAAAPADTFHAATVTPAARRSGMTAPDAPNAAAERRIAPRLRGSWMPSSAMMRMGLAASSRSTGSRYSYGQDLEGDALVRAAVGEAIEDRLGDLAHLDLLLDRTRHDLGDALVGVDALEHEQARWRPFRT